MGSRGPDFLVIGGQRSGTTWLSEILREHPRVFSLPIKELHYCDAVDEAHYSARNRRFRHLKDSLIAVGKGREGNISWYLKYFLARLMTNIIKTFFQKIYEKGLSVVTFPLGTRFSLTPLFSGSKNCSHI